MKKSSKLFSIFEKNAGPEFQALAEIAQSAVLILQDGDVRYANPAAMATLGLRDNELLDRDFFQLIHSDFRDQARASFTRIREGDVHPPSELMCVSAKGETKWIELTARSIQLNLQPAILVVFLDITERRNTEQALREGEEHYHGLVNLTFDGVAIHQDGVIKKANRSFAAIYGYSLDEIINKAIFDLIAPELHHLVTSKIQAAEESVYESVGVRKDGTRIPVEASAQNCMLNGRPARVFAIRDISERRRLEDQLRQAQKMEAVGRLAGGLAHDFNNLLTVISFDTDLMLGRMGAGDPLRKNVEQIKKAGERAAALTSQLLAFSREQVLQPVILDLNAVVIDMHKMWSRVIGEDIELKTLLSKDLLKVRADRGQLEQVLMNLVVNARDAMPRGGKLTVETANAELDELYCRRHMPAKPGHYALLVVSDTGQGMDADTKARIFEPFFTTKEKGRGTGLGLSTVYGIIKQSGGFIWVYSEVGHGTSFKIYLPETKGEIEQAQPQAQSKARSARGSETILLVEDEDEVRSLVREVLEMNGYTVLEARNGREALQIGEGKPGLISLLLTDVIMPGMSGRELAERLTVDNASMKVVYMSGYTENAILDNATLYQGVLETGAEFIQKPFSAETLERKVRQVLDG